MLAVKFVVQLEAPLTGLVPFVLRRPLPLLKLPTVLQSLQELSPQVVVFPLLEILLLEHFPLEGGFGHRVAQSQLDQLFLRPLPQQQVVLH